MKVRQDRRICDHCFFLLLTLLSVGDQLAICINPGITEFAFVYKKEKSKI
jgi:hypothetical protein